MSSILSNTIASIWQLVSISFSIRKRKLHITIAEKVCIDQQKEKNGILEEGWQTISEFRLKRYVFLCLSNDPNDGALPLPLLKR